MPIGWLVTDLANEARHEIDVVPQFPCVLLRLAVVRVRPWTADEKHTLSVIRDLELELEGKERTPIDVAMYTHLRAQLGERPAITPRALTIQSLTVGNEEMRRLVLPTHGDPLFQDVDEMIDQIIPAMGGLGLRCMAGQRVTLTVVNRGDACDLSGCWFAFGARVLDAHECSN